MRVPEDADRDFVAGCIVVNENDEILLIDHSKLDMWLHPGGHVEEDETPDETALRETREETGWEVKILDEYLPEKEFENSEELPRPMNVNLHQIREGHWHCELRYPAVPVEKVDATHEHEHDGQAWFSVDEIKQMDVPEEIVETAKETVEEVRSSRSH